MGRLGGILLVGLFAGTVGNACAAVVERMQEGYVLFREEIPTKPGDRYLARDADGRATAYVKVMRTRNKVVVARVESGSTEVGQELELVRTGPAPEWDPPREAPFRWPVPALTLGVSGGRASLRVESVSQSSMARGRFLELRGSHYGARLGSVFALTPWLSVDPTLDYQAFSVSYRATASDLCGTTTDCYVRMAYLGLSLGARVYPFGTERWRPFLGLGWSVQLPMQREATAVEVNSLRLTSFGRLALGTDIFLAPGRHLSVALTSSLLAGFGSNSSLNLTGLRIEHGWEL